MYKTCAGVYVYVMYDNTVIQFVKYIITLSYYYFALSHYVCCVWRIDTLYFDWLLCVVRDSGT